MGSGPVKGFSVTLGCWNFYYSYFQFILLLDILTGLYVVRNKERMKKYDSVI